MTRRIGLLGGTFDPIHVGHLDLAAAAAEALALTEVVLIPAHVPPHRPAPVASAFHRFAMAALAIDGRPTWQTSDTELLEATQSYTSTTLDRFHRAGYQPRELHFLIGADAFKEIASWKDYPSILDKANFAVIARPGFSLRTLERAVPAIGARTRAKDRASETFIDLIDAPTHDVSATAIRQRLAAGASIDGLVPPLVQRHIARHGLYRPAASDRRSSDVSSITPAGRLHGES